MKAVKDRLTGFRGDTRAFVVDADPDLVADAGDGDLDQAIRRREAYGVVEDRIERARQAVRLAHDHRAVLSRPRIGDAGIAGLAADAPTADQLFEQRPEVDGSKMSAGELRIGSGRLADVADQPVHPGDVVADNFGQPSAKFGILNP